MVENIRFSSVIYTSELWISRDNSCVDVDVLISGLWPSFRTVKPWVYFTTCTRDIYMWKLILFHLLILHFDLKQLKVVIGEGVGVHENSYTRSYDTEKNFSVSLDNLLYNYHGLYIVVSIKWCCIQCETFQL